MAGMDVFSLDAKHLGKSARTRAKLKDAAIIVIGQMGVEAASVKEITRQADIANGTFYLHFDSKEQIVREVCSDIASGITHNIDESLSPISDAIDRVATATRRYLHYSSTRPHWARAFVSAFWTLPYVRDKAMEPLRADLQLGVDQGCFNADIDHFLIQVFGSMMISANLQILNGAPADYAGSRTAELQLKMLGVPIERAREAAHRKIDFSIPNSPDPNAP